MSRAFGHRWPGKLWAGDGAGFGREPWHPLPACSHLPKVQFLFLIIEAMSEVCREVSWNRGFLDTSLEVFLQCFE